MIGTRNTAPSGGMPSPASIPGRRFPTRIAATEISVQ